MNKFKINECYAFSVSWYKIRLSLARKMLSQHIHLIPGQKLFHLCWVSIQRINEKEDSEENNDASNIHGGNDGINDLKQTFVILKQRISLNNNLEEIDINQFKGYFHYKTIFLK